jgi:hypothetical protein
MAESSTCPQPHECSNGCGFCDSTRDAVKLHEWTTCPQLEWGKAYLQWHGGNAHRVRAFPAAANLWPKIDWAQLKAAKMLYADPPTANAPLKNGVDSGSNTIFMIARGGGVGYGTKALHAQLAGATAVVIIQSDGQQPHPPGSSFMGNRDAASVTIPVFMISYADSAHVSNCCRSTRHHR